MGLQGEIAAESMRDQILNIIDDEMLKYYLTKPEVYKAMEYLKARVAAVSY